MSQLTSEKIAKALKGAGLSAKQRIEKACEAWNNEAMFFPNKDDFLFEWVCSAFAKPNMKKLDDCCLLQVPYWTLLTSLLKHYQEKSYLDPKRSVPTIHVNLVSTVSALLQQLYKDDGKIVQDRIEFLDLTHQCLEILFSDSFSLSYRPAFEHVSGAVDQVLLSLSAHINICQETNDMEELNALHQLCLTAQVLLKKFDSQLIMAANQKKIFSSIVEKSLVKLSSVRRRINFLKCDQDSAGISHIITNIICHALFHADTILEFTSVLKDVNKDNASSGDVKQTNYVARLFDTLENMVNNTKDQEQMLDALDIAPVLFSAFLDAFRHKRNTNTSVMQDISRMAEFGIFVYLSKIIGNVKEKAVSAYLETLCRLLKELLQWNVYSARNDDIAKSQQDVLNSLAQDVVSYLGDSKRYNQGLVLDLADTLLQIDFSLIESRVHSLWPILLNSENDAQESCLKLAKSILSTYTASRQLDVFVEDLMTYIGQIDADNVYSVLRKPMFTREFLTEFSSLIRKSMPVAQALGIFKTFQQSLTDIIHVATDEHIAKKQKKSVRISNKINKAALITAYFVEFTNALKLTQQQARAFEEPAMSVFEDFIKPLVNQSVDIEDDILPAMQAHSALISVFYEVYFLKIDAHDQEWLAKTYIQIFNKHIKSTSLGSRITVTICANAMLQHSYYTSLSGVSSTSQTVDLVIAIVDFITEKESKKSWYESTQWNGSILELEDKNTVKLACWKLLSDEWFESVVQHIDNARAEKIASIIYLSLTNDLTSTLSVSAQLLNTSLLRSANFYEAKCFKDCNIRNILRAIIDMFGSKITNANDVSKVAAKMISVVNISRPLSVDQMSLGYLLKVLKQDNMDQDIDASSSITVEKITTFLKLLLLFPNEYFEKNERPQILYLATMIDIWSVSCTNAHPLIRAKLSLMCRSLHLRFIGYFSANSILGMDSAVLNWLASSSQIWSAGEDNTELKSVLVSLDHVTNELDLNICRRIIMNASAKTPDDHSMAYFQQTLKQRTDSLDNDVSKTSLGKLINLIRAINLALTSRKFTQVDLSNVIYATDFMSQISQYIISCLEDAKTSISSILSQVKQEAPSKKTTIIAQNISKFESVKYVFHLTRLLQEYARIVGPEVDEVISAKDLSTTLTALASTFIQFLQSALLSDEKSENHAVLNMTTEFIAAFCSILSRYQQIETTKRVLAAIWFVYSLVLNTGDQQSVEILSNAFASWIQSLSKEQYAILIESFIEQSEEEANNRGNITKEQHHLVFLSLFSQLLKSCNDSEKGRLRKQVPTFVLKLSLIAGKTTSLKYLQEMLKLLIQLTGDQSYHFSDYDASLVLSCLLQVAHPTAPERFKSQINREIAHGIFDDVCAVLSNFITHHKEQVVYMMPPFIAFIQSLLHCFKSTHVSLVIGTNAPPTTTITRKRKLENKDATTTKAFTGRTIPLLYEFTPLDDSSAQRLSRVLTTIPQKQHTAATTSTATKNAKSTQSLHKIIAKHTPSILIEYFTIQSNPTMSVVQPSTKSILTQALYDILDMCSDTDRTFILACLDGPGKSLFKVFYTSWKENHKYTGQ